MYIFLKKILILIFSILFIIFNVSFYLMEYEFTNKMKLMIEANEPYHVLFNAFIHFCLDKKIFMNDYQMHKAVLLYVKPVASDEIVKFFYNNINIL